MTPLTKSRMRHGRSRETGSPRAENIVIIRGIIIRPGQIYYYDAGGETRKDSRRDNKLPQGESINYVSVAAQWFRGYSGEIINCPSQSLFIIRMYLAGGPRAILEKIINCPSQGLFIIRTSPSGGPRTTPGEIIKWVSQSLFVIRMSPSDGP